MSSNEVRMSPWMKLKLHELPDALLIPHLAIRRSNFFCTFIIHVPLIMEKSIHGSDIKEA